MGHIKNNHKLKLRWKMKNVGTDFHFQVGWTTGRPMFSECNYKTWGGAGRNTEITCLKAEESCRKTKDLGG